MFLFVVYILSSFSLSSGNFENNLKQYLSLKLKGYESFSFKIITKVDAGKITIPETAEFKKHGKYGYITAQNIVNGKVEKFIITVELTLYKEVLAAKDDIKPKEEIESSELVSRLVDVASLPGKAAESFDQISGRRSKTFIRKGEPVLIENTEKLPDINLGQSVTAVMIRGNVMINMPAFARQEGYTGDVIKIRTTDNKYFFAKIYDKNRVLIIE